MRFIYIYICVCVCETLADFCVCWFVVISCVESWVMW